MPRRISERVDWDAVRAEVTEHLQRLIRLETVNPPGNESLVATYLQQVVEREGLSAQVLESAPGRGNFVTRLPGSGRQRPLLLMGHGDIVPVEADRWRHPPFAAEIRDGMLWGRGAVDMKHQVAAELVVLLMVQRLGLRLDRDLVMVTFADEEAGGRYGARWMWAQHRELLDAEYAINEGGGQAVDVAGKRFYLCQTGEKGSARFKIVARGAGGHGSIPRDGTAMPRLARALVTLSEQQLPTRLSATVVPFLVPGSTDAVSVPGITVYGFMPMALSASEADGMHNDDERIAIDHLLFGTRALFEIVTRFCNAH